MQGKSFGILIVLVIALMVAAGSLFVIKETERGVLLRFGALKNSDLGKGLHVKIPFFDTVKKFDGRILTLDMSPESYFTVENKRLIVDAFVKWRVQDTAEYYRATGGDGFVANQRIAARMNDGLRNQFGRETLHEVVSGKRDEMMATLKEEVGEDVERDLGIKIIDVRVKRIDLPDDVSQSVYDRMTADREKEAREYRSEGEEQAERIRADADKQRTIIAAEAYRDAELARGEGDAKATAIYADAFNKDREFYDFTRSLNAYKKSFDSDADFLLIDPDSDFFKYLKDSEGGR